jgi:hypothetical protein
VLKELLFAVAIALALASLLPGGRREAAPPDAPAEG